MRPRSETTPAGFAVKPQAVVRRLPFRRMRGGRANRFLKRGLSFVLVAGHQKTKPIQLRQILTGSAHADFRKSRNFTCLSSADKRSLRALSLQFLQTTRNFLRVRPAVESGNPKITFALRAEPAARCDDDVQIVQHSVEHLPARQARRRRDPNVRRILSAIDSQAGATRAPPLRMRALPM